MNSAIETYSASLCARYFATPAIPSAQHHCQLVQTFEPRIVFVHTASLFETIPVSIPTAQHSVSVPPLPVTATYVRIIAA